MPPTKLMLSSSSKLSGDTLTVDFINVGQGNAVLISCPFGEDEMNSYMLIDAGSQNASLSGAPFKKLQKYLDTVVGDNQINTVILSHGDKDHVSFFPYLTQTKKPDRVFFGENNNTYSDDVQYWLNKLIDDRNCTVEKFKNNTFDLSPDLDYGIEGFEGFEIEVYTLAANFGFSSNSQSIVIYIALGDYGVIIPGDADWYTESMILQNFSNTLFRGKQILLMPAHHGSNESSGKDFLNLVNPKYNAISASGKNKGYAHPNSEVIKRLISTSNDSAAEHTIVSSPAGKKPYVSRTFEEAIFLTGTNGDIRFITDGTDFKIYASSLGKPNLFIEPGDEELYENLPTEPEPWVKPSFFPKNFHFEPVI